MTNQPALPELNDQDLEQVAGGKPPWLENRKCFAAYLVYAVFANQIKLGDITLEDFPARGL